jgi:hypothetical protein
MKELDEDDMLFLTVNVTAFKIRKGKVYFEIISNLNKN